MAQVVVDGLLTNYTSSGKGDVVLLLHGWGDTSRTFASLAEILSGNHQVIALDLPGFGNTEASKEAWGLDDYASFVAHFLQKIAANPTVVVGHSNGGAIAIRAVATHKLQPKKLVLLAASGIRGEYKGRNIALRLVAKTGKLLASPLPKRVKKRLQHKLYTTVGSDMLVAEHLQETFKKVVTDDVRADAEHITIPTVLIYGDEDEATPVRYAEEFNARLKNATLHVIPGAAHFVHHEAKDKVNSLVKEFIDV